MKLGWKKISMALVAFAISTQAWSLILIEPYGGYQFSIGGDYESPAGKEDFSFSGIGYGGRLGVTLATIMFGISYDWMNFDIEPDSGGTTATEQTNFGAFVGWNPKLDGFRFWGEYFFDVTNTYTDMTPEGEESGSGWGLGVGYKFNPWLALNAEYRSWSLDEDQNGATTDTNGQSIFVSLSFPFDIL